MDYVQPPSTTISCEVIILLSSDAKNNAAFAMSSGKTLSGKH